MFNKHARDFFLNLPARREKNYPNAQAPHSAEDTVVTPEQLPRVAEANASAKKLPHHAAPVDGARGAKCQVLELPEASHAVAVLAGAVGVGTKIAADREPLREKITNSKERTGSQSPIYIHIPAPCVGTWIIRIKTFSTADIM